MHSLIKACSEHFKIPYVVHMNGNDLTSYFIFAVCKHSGLLLVRSKRQKSFNADQVISSDINAVYKMEKNKQKHPNTQYN